MEKLKQFESYFSKYCCVHLRDPIPLCRLNESEKPKPSANYRVIDGNPIPVGDRGFPVESPPAVPTFPIEVQKQGEQMVFSMVIENCIVVPSPSGERLVLGYRVDDSIIETSVHPDQIVSITIVAQAKLPSQEKPLIVQ